MWLLFHVYLVEIQLKSVNELRMCKICPVDCCPSLNGTHYVYTCVSIFPWRPIVTLEGAKSSKPAIFSSHPPSPNIINYQSLRYDSGMYPGGLAHLPIGNALPLCTSMYFIKLLTYLLIYLRFSPPLSPHFYQHNIISLYIRR